MREKLAESIRQNNYDGVAMSDMECLGRADQQIAIFKEFIKTMKLPLLSDDDELIKITDSVCREFGIEWGQWADIKRGSIESLIIEIYRKVKQAQLDKVLKAMLEECDKE